MQGTDPGVDVAEFAEELATMAEEAETAPASAPPPASQGPDAGAAPINLDLVMRIPVVMKVVLGGASMSVAALSRMKRGEIVPLDRRAGDVADIVVNGRTLARGKVVMIDEATGQLGISITELVDVRSSAH